MTGSYIGPVTCIVFNLPFNPQTKASVVPSPPSANGLTITVASGFAAKIPALAASPASIELKLPFSESITTTAFI